MAKVTMSYGTKEDGYTTIDFGDVPEPVTSDDFLLLFVRFIQAAGWALESIEHSIYTYEFMSTKFREFGSIAQEEEREGDLE